VLSLKRITESLTGKLVVFLGLIILAGSGTFWYISIRTDKKNLMDNTVAFVSSFSEVVKNSIRHDMMLFKRQDIQRIVESIGSSEAIEKVRVYDSRGVVYYSSHKDDEGLNVDASSPACTGCHIDPLRPAETLDADRRWSIYEEPGGTRVLGFVEPIYNEPDCYSAACHAHSPEQKVLGVLATDFSLREIDMRVRQKMVDTSVYMLSFLAVSVSLLYLILWRLVLRPVSSLSRGMRRVSSGDLAQKVPIMSTDEIGRLARTFNSMTEELSTARHRMEKWTQSLEDEVAKRGDEIKKAHNKLLQAEKFAALGRLTSEIAHEIRNPLTALGGFGRRLQKIAIEEREKEYADIVVSEVNRLEHILKEVMAFSREARPNLERQPVTDAVKESLTTFSSIIDDNSINVNTALDARLPVLMDKEQVRQAANNLISNAIDAMPGGGTLEVSTAREELNSITYVAMHVSNTGEDIPDDKLNLIFEPFYTTKIGHGTGLGLSISKKIMEEHGGFIRAENMDGGGVTVSLYFPFQDEADLSKTPCWEFMQCGRDKGNTARCPAYPNFGRVCWVVAGTFCEGKVQGAFAQKYEDCRKCDFYKKVVSGEV
jgi:two-component system NtrC family sensor kinase